MTFGTTRSGGSGGGPEGGKRVSASGTYEISGNRVEIVSRIPQAADPSSLATPGPSNITLLATGETPVGLGPGGTIDMRGNQGVRITAGPPLLEILPAASSSTDGIELAVALTKKITLRQGLEQLGPSVEMSDSGIKIESGLAGTLTLESMTSITFKVAGGLASITLTPMGVEIKGLLVNVN